MKRYSFAAPLLAGAVVASLIFAAAGCGGSGTSAGNLPLPGGSSGGAVSAFVGRTYTSQVTLTDGQIGTLTATVAADNTASGTFEINDPTRKVSPASPASPVKSRLVIATPFLSGTFDPATGAISLSGSYTVGGQTIPISVIGTLPIPPATSGGSLTTTINGQSYTSSFGSTVTNPTPSPSATPTPNPSATPTPSPSPSATPAPGAVNQITLTPEPGTSPNPTTNLLIGTNVTATLTEFTPASGFSRIAINCEDASGRAVNVAIITNGPLAPGTHPISIDASSFTAPGAGLSYREGVNFNLYWQAGGINFNQVDGTMIVDQVDANKVRVRLINVLMDARPNSKTSKGSLRANGIIETTAPSTYVAP